MLSYFAFDELTATAEGLVPTAPMYAFFGTEDTPRMGGFRMTPEDGSAASQNLAAKAPGEAGYSPLWTLMRLAEADFTALESLADVPSKLSAAPVGFGSAVNFVLRSE